MIGKMFSQLRLVVLTVSMLFIQFVAKSQIEVSVPFDDGFVGLIGQNTQQATGIQRFSTLTVARAFFVQSTASGTFEFSQGNDIGGTLRLQLSNGNKINIPGALVWRINSGNTNNVFGFVANSGVSLNLNSYGGPNYVINGGSATGKSNFGFKINSSTYTLPATGSTASGNAASGQTALDDLNAYLNSLPRVLAPAPVNFALNTANQDPGDFSITGFNSSDILLCAVGFVNPPAGTTFNFSVNTGLTLSTGYNSWTGLTRVSFTGTQANINAALASLTISTGTTAGNINLSVSGTVNTVGYYFNPTNGHYYKPVSTGAYYPDAKTNAHATTFKGQEGYLITLTSASEENFIIANVPQSNIWFAATDRVTDGTWVIDDGPELGTVMKTQNGPTAGNIAGVYNNWCSGEPNGANHSEDYPVAKWNGASCWNDLNPNYNNPYIIEYGTWSNPDDQAFTDFYSASTSYTAICTSANTPVAPTVVTEGSRNGSGTVQLVVSSPAGTTVDWYAASSGGNVLAGGNSVTTFTTPIISTTTSFYAQTRNSTSGCLSTTRTALTANVSTISSFTPTTAKSGETITITGSDFLGTTSVKIGGVEARSFTIVSATQITAIVPANATINTNVSVTNPDATNTAPGFTFSCTSNALQFDGVDDYVQIGSQLPLTSNGNFTIEAWVKPSLVDNQYHGFFGLQANPRAPSMWLGPNGSLHTDSYGGTTRYDMLVDNFFTANKWTHVAWVKNGTTYTVYKNGVQFATRTAPTNVELPAGNFWIGKVDNFFAGAIDEVRVWNIAKTAQEIAANLGVEYNGNETGLAAYYNFNQGTAAGSNTSITTLNNLTGGANLNGTLTNMARTGTTSNFVTGVGPVILTQPATTLSLCNSVTSGNTLTVSAIGQQLIYQWYSNTTNSNTGGTAVTGATTATYTAPSVTAGTFYYYVIVSSACNGVTEASTVSTVNVYYPNNWNKIYETTNPSRNSTGEIVYTSGFGKTGGAASSFNGSFNRIKYRLENNVAGTLRWAEVSFDAWANVSLADLQIPDLVNNLLIQKNVSNIEVSSNMPGVYIGNFSTGRLELWNQDYVPNRSGLSPAGDNANYDWDDLVAVISNGHGSFQIHNVSPEKEQTIFAWNMHRNVGNPEIGIGNAPTGHPDWTFNTTNGSANFKVQIFVQDAPVITPNGTISTCVGTPVTLTSSAGSSYLWSNGSTSQSIITADAGNYTVTVTQANGCNATSLPKTVSLTAPPAAATITGTQEVCVGRTTQFNAAGQSGALTFNGTTNIVETANNISALNITGNITVEAWVKVNQLPNDWVRLVGKGDGSTRTYGFWLATNGQLLWQIYGNGADPALFSTTSLQPGAWYHIAATRVGNVHTIYINGVANASVTASIIPISNTLPLTLGYHGSIHTYLNGQMDEVRVWNVGRSAAQINDNKDIEISAQSGLIAYYKFNQGTPGGNNAGLTTLIDGSGNGYNGTLRNFVLSGTSSNWSSRSGVPASGFWSSSNSSVASVSSLGLVTGVAAGNATMTFSITGTGGCANVVSTRTITVNPLPSITYPNSSYSFERTKPITAIEPTTNGVAVNSYAISPALPTGLSFNTTTGVISGTSSVIKSPTLYTVTTTSTSGCIATRSFTLEIFNAVVPSALSYSPASQTVRQGTAITTMTPIVSGGVVAFYSISAPLPAGLSFNTSTGVISGTLTAQQTGTVTYTITATNSGGNASTTVTLVYNTAPTNYALSNASVAENANSGTTVGTLNGIDADAGDTFTYALVSGPGSSDNASFIISGNTLKTSAVFDFETKSTYSIRIRVTDAGGLYTGRDVIITVNDVNEAPTNISADASSVAENAASGTSVATLSTTDVDAGDSFTYTLVSGTGDTDNASFTIAGSTLKTATVFDFESKSSYSVRVRVTDAGGLTFEKVFTIGVTDVNDAPTNISADASSVAENAASGTSVATLSAIDADAGDSFTYTLVSGTGDTDNASFTIAGSTLKTAAVFDFETKSSYSVRVRVTDAGGLTFEKVFTISVTDVNDAPTNISADASSVAENAASGTSVATLSAIDADAGDTFTYTLVSGTGDTDNASFTIAGSTLKTATVFDFETKSSYSVRVRVTDAGGLTFEKVFTISVTDVNEAPTALALSNTSVLENAASGTTVGSLAGTDADAGDTHTYTLVSGIGSTDNASFTITGNTLKTAAAFDFETKSSYSVRVQVADAGGLTFEKVFTISVTDVNEAPTNITLSKNSVLENAVSGTTVGTLAGTDVDAGDTFTYTLVSGTGATDNASFTIAGGTLKTAAVFDYETKNSYSVRVKVTDAGGLSFEKVFTITVTDVNEAPTLAAITDRRVYNVSTSQIVNLSGITGGPETAQTTVTTVSTDKPTTFSSISVVGTQIQFTLAAGITTPQDVVVSVKVKDNGGVANGGVDTLVRTFILGIDPLPVAAASPNLITLGATAQLSATGANAINYTWVAVGGSGIVGSGANINVRPAGTTTYAVVVTNSFGYQATIPVLLTVIADYKLVPNNLLTPDGDGVNDKWVIPNIDMYPDNEVKIYDKAGRPVFAKRGYNNEWDGSLNGKKLKEDAYFYVIKFNKDGVLPIRGYVSIVR